MPPAHAFLLEDAPHLAAGHLDAVLAGHGGQRIQRPLHVSLRIRYRQLTGEFIRGLAGRREPDQIEDGAAFLRGQPRSAAAARLHSQAVEAAVIEGLEPLPYGLRMAA
jgi:hypothetical protein